eukprot:NODE_430_length_7576_cov_0.738665.p1 type:complete len:448 gc:universal NODE_430_length_7576_cov_0.738665:4914-3571(-)
MIIKQLPDTLKVMDLMYTFHLKLELYTLPNLTYFSYFCYSYLEAPILPRLPDTLEYIDFENSDMDIFPLNATGLKVAYYIYCGSHAPFKIFPYLAETIETFDLSFCNFYGSVNQDFKNVKSLALSDNSLVGNLTISSPNITSLNINSNYFDRLFIPNIDKITQCSTRNIHFEPDNMNELNRLQTKGCQISYKSPPSPDCPNLILFLRQLNMHLTQPDKFSQLSSLNSCCNDITGSISCTGNRITGIKIQYLTSNGTLNTTLLPNSLVSLRFTSNNNIGGSFPDLSSLSNLVFLDLNFNQLTGPITGKLPTNLKSIDVVDNQLNGTIPFLGQLEQLYADNNNFDSVENQLQGNNLKAISISYNKIAGIVDLSNFVTIDYYVFNFRSNFIDKILTLNKITNYNCDVTMNNIAVSDLTNLTSCKYELQSYSDPINFETCKYTMNLLQKAG